jgi:acyl dehydratase
MTFQFLKPVYAGDALTCVGIVETVKPGRAFTRVSFSFTVTNQASAVVMKGDSSGVIAVRT